MQFFTPPAGALGPGSQPPEEDGAELNCLTMPTQMETYHLPPLPEPDEARHCPRGMQVLQQLLAVLEEYRIHTPAWVLDLSPLSALDRTFVNRALGEGEVGIRVRDDQLRVQETRLTGVWRIRSQDDQDGCPSVDRIEVAAIPALVGELMQAHTSPIQHWTFPVPPEDLLGARGALSELQDQAQTWHSGEDAVVMNLTLLPLFPQDLDYLVQVLGEGPLTLLSRGYGNCRISSTQLRHCWWVQHFNSEDKMILNSIELADVPNAALAAQEDIEDSAARLREIIDALR